MTIEAILQTRVGRISAGLEAFAASIGAATYWNYVNPSQDSLSSYDAEKIEFLKDVAAERDPIELSQRCVSRHFEICLVD